jgi:hypothetical protein
MFDVILFSKLFIVCLVKINLTLCPMPLAFSNRNSQHATPNPHSEFRIPNSEFFYMPFLPYAFSL